MLVMGGQTPADRLIQRSAWKGYSLKFGCSILHRASLKTRIDFALGPARVVCHAQHLGVPDRYAGLRIMGYVSYKIQIISGCVSAFDSRRGRRPD